MKLTGTTSPKEVYRTMENWQRRRQEDLPNAFYAYDNEELQSERVISYRLSKSKLKALKAFTDNCGEFELVVHLGLREKEASASIPSQPDFILYLEAVSKEEEEQPMHCYALKWVKNGIFSTTYESDTNSIRNAIPGASAYLFVHSWMETSHVNLAEPFNAKTRVLGTRVKSYIFSKRESASIMTDVEYSIAAEAKDKSGNTKAHLDVHLGNGMAVWDHPFSFRPVLEVKNAVDKKKPAKRPALVNGQVIESGDSFYDYSFPNPPGLPD